MKVIWCLKEKGYEKGGGGHWKPMACGRKVATFRGKEKGVVLNNAPTMRLVFHRTYRSFYMLFTLMSIIIVSFNGEEMKLTDS